MVSGLLWRGLERIGTQGVGFVNAIILARLLPVKDFGTIAIVTVFISFAGVFVDSGLGTALIQKKEIGDDDCDSVFFLNLLIGIIAYSACFIGAPLIATFYKEEALRGILRLAALSLIIGAFSSIQLAVMNREMRFNLSFKVNIISLFLASATGIAFAFSGFGVWSLVYSQLIGAGSSALLLWLTVAWRPHLVFSLKSARGLFKFGSKYLLARVITEVYVKLSILFIGKCFSLSSLAFYSRGFFFPSFIVGSVCGTIDGVLFPALASSQDNIVQFKNMLRRSVSTSTFILFPTLVGLGVVAKPMVTILLTEKWLSAVVFLQISCITVAFTPVLGISNQAVNAIGRSDMFLKMESINKLIGIAIFFSTLSYGLMAVVIGQMIYSLSMCLVLCPWINSRYLGYKLSDQLGDILPALGCSLLMGAFVAPLALLFKNQLTLLSCDIVAGVIIYLLLCRVFKIKALGYLLTVLKERTQQVGELDTSTPTPAL